MSYENAPLQAIKVLAARSAWLFVDGQQLAAAGLSRSTIQLWINSGRLHRLHPRAFSVIPPSMLDPGGPMARRCQGLRAERLPEPRPGRPAAMAPRPARAPCPARLAQRPLPTALPPGIVIHRPVRSRPATARPSFGSPRPRPRARSGTWLRASPPCPCAERSRRRRRNGKLSTRPPAAACSTHSPTHKGAGAHPLPCWPRAIVARGWSAAWLEDLLIGRSAASTRPPASCGQRPPARLRGGLPLATSARLVVEADGSDHLLPDSAGQRQRARHPTSARRLSRPPLLLRGDGTRAARRR